jgi:hypothetical protein
MSFNDHRNHCGTTRNSRDAAGEVAHAGCVAFGIDRHAPAPFAARGVDLAKWSAGVTEAPTVRDDIAGPL